MVAYKALHNADEDNWRCMRCEKLGKFSEGSILEHLMVEHSMSGASLKQEHGGEIFLYPVEEKETKEKKSVNVQDLFKCKMKNCK